MGAGPSRTIVQIEREELDAAIAEDEKGAVTLYVVGCIDYTFPADHTVHHQTGFIRHLRRDAIYIIKPSQGDLPFNLLRMQHAPIDLIRPPD
jgi:hypothetical protein